MSGTVLETSAMDEPKGESTPTPDATPPNAYTELVGGSTCETRVLHVFISPDGLRAVWRFALYIVLWRALHFLLGVFLFYLGPYVHPAIWLDVIEESGRFVIVAIPALLM